MLVKNSASANSGTLAASHPQWTPDDPEYYNDLPGKVPPDVSGPPPVPPLPNYQAPGGGPAASSTTAAAAAGLVAKKAAAQRHGHAVDLSDNLIDLNADVPVLSRTDGASGTSGVSGASAGLPPFSDHEYVNGIMGSSNTNQKNPSSKDPFDMRNFSFCFLLLVDYYFLKTKLNRLLSQQIPFRLLYHRHCHLPCSRLAVAFHRQ